MSCCCSNILKLCKVHSCTDFIDPGVTAAVEGIYTLTVDFLGVDFQVRSADLAVDDEIKFPASSLNENYVFRGSITKPDGTPLLIRVDSIDYDCIEFETKPSYTV